MFSPMSSPMNSIRYAPMYGSTMSLATVRTCDGSTWKRSETSVVAHLRLSTVPEGSTTGKEKVMVSTCGASVGFTMKRT